MEELVILCEMPVHVHYSVAEYISEYFFTLLTKVCKAVIDLRCSEKSNRFFF